VGFNGNFLFDFRTSTLSIDGTAFLGKVLVKATFYVGVADPRDCEATFHALSVAATQMERTDGFDKAAALPS
jgi:hypothetical protein